MHVTHDLTEVRGANHVIELDHGTLIPHHSVRPLPTPNPVHLHRTRLADHRTGDTELLTLRGTGTSIQSGSPWAHRALHDVNLSVSAGEGVLIVGHNGSGKSTLAWIIAGLLRPTEGTGQLSDTPLHQCVGRIGLSLNTRKSQLQRPTVSEDIASAGSIDDAQTQAVLELVGLHPSFVDRRIDELSGGEQRRVALAGLLARRPPVMVLDERFAGLDNDARDSLAEVLTRLRSDTNVTLLIISHDVHPAVDAVDRIIRLSGGTITADDTIDRATAPGVHHDG